MLKINAVFAILLVSSSIIAQTSVISTKSHSAPTKDLLGARDGFGEREMYYPPTQMRPVIISSIMEVETIRKIDDHCVIITGKRNAIQQADTVCNHWYYEQHNYNKQSMLDYHGSSVILIGFPENAPIINKNDAPFSGRSSRFSLNWMFALLVVGSLGGFVLFPKSKA